MAKAIKTKGLEELRPFRRRYLRQHAMGRISEEGLHKLEVAYKALVTAVEEIDELDGE